MPVIRPWATMPNKAALMPKVRQRGEAEHHEAQVGDRRKAMSRFMSVWARHTSAP